MERGNTIGKCMGYSQPQQRDSDGQEKKKKEIGNT